MSKRKMKKTGWVDYKKHPRGPHGRGLCRMCGEEVPKGRRTFCNDICVHQYRLRNEPRYQARVLKERDAGVCEFCGINACVVEAQFKQEIVEARKSVEDMMWADEPDWKEIGRIRKEREKEVRDRYRKEGWAPLNTRFWEVHHKVPVSEGGGPQDYPKDMPYEDQLITVCSPCHKKETKKLRKRLSK
jgi:5-methylcytosine-specific restriction protein A